MKHTSRRPSHFLPHNHRPVALYFLMLMLMTGLASCHSSQPPRRDDAVANRLKIAKEELESLHKNVGLSNSVLLNATPEQLQEALMQSHYPDLPVAREQFRFWQLQSESGRIPIQVRSLATTAFLSMATRLTQQSKCMLAYLPINCVSGWTAGLNKDQSGWRFLGPFNVGGRTRTIAIDPHNSQNVWIGSVAGGLWHSTDGGKSFAVVDDLLPSLVISSIAIDPRDSTTIYAGTGEGFFNLDSLRGAGILVTRKGQSWSQISSTVPKDDNSPFLFVNRLAISPDGATLLAATWKGVYFSVDQDHNLWTKATGTDGDVADVVFNPGNPKYAIAGGLNTGTIYFSNDGGQSWREAQHDGTWLHVWPDRTTSPSRVEVTFAAANPSIVYASVDNNSGEIWQSTDTGQSFHRMDSETPDGDLAYYLGDQGWYDNAIWAGSADPTFIVVGGVNLWKSTDGGKTLLAISNWEDDDSIHADHHTIVSDPHKSSTVYLGNDGGVYKTDDITQAGTDQRKVQGWTKLNNNYGVTQFYGIAWSMASGVLAAGAQDNGTLMLRAGAKDWTEEFGGDGGYCATDSRSHYIYGEYVYLSLHRSADDKTPAEFINGEYIDTANRTWWKQDKSLIIMDSYNSTANFIAPFLLDPNDKNQNTILAGGASLWRTNDAKTQNSPTTGPHWSVIKPPVPGWSDSGQIPDYISAVMIRKGTPNIIWVGYNRGELYVTTNAQDSQPTWTLLPNSGLEKRPSRLVTKILPDSSDPKTYYVAYGGYSDNGRRDNVWKTPDAGKTWTNISKTLTPSPAFVITMHPNNPAYLYLGTERGIFASEDAGKHWSLSNEGPINTAVEDLTWNGATLIAATHGRGAWSIDLSLSPHRGNTGP